MLYALLAMPAHEIVALLAVTFVAVSPVGAGQFVLHATVVKVTEADQGLSVAAPVEFVQTACTCTS